MNHKSHLNFIESPLNFTGPTKPNHDSKEAKKIQNVFVFHPQKLDKKESFPLLKLATLILKSDNCIIC